MNKRITGFILCLFVILVFAACRDTDPDKQIDISTWFVISSEEGTRIRFNNSNNKKCAVLIYSDSLRHTKIAEVKAGENERVPSDPNPSGASFYPTYQIKVEGVTIPYDGDVIVARIDEDKTNVITIPSLRTLAGKEPDKNLITETYIKIQNNGSSSLVLRKGNNELFLEGAYSTILNGGETGLYKISAGSVSDYSLRENTIYPVDFPGNITVFSAAYIYLFRFDGTTLVLQKQIKLTPAGLGEYF